MGSMATQKPGCIDRRPGSPNTGQYDCSRLRCPQSRLRDAFYRAGRPPTEQIRRAHVFKSMTLWVDRVAARPDAREGTPDDEFAARFSVRFPITLAK